MTFQHGQLLRNEMLGSEALYRVIADDGDHVEVEVVSAPGLAPGHRVRVTAAAAREMTPAPAGSEARVTDTRAPSRRASSPGTA